MTYAIGIIVVVIILVVSFIINDNTRIIYPVYLFEFVNKYINDDFRTKQMTESNLLIDDDGFETLSVSDLKRMKRKEKIIPVFVKTSNTLDSYLYEVFKDEYIVLCKKENKIFKVGDFIVVNHQGNYYLREVYNDDKSVKIAVYRPCKDCVDLDVGSRIEIDGEVVSYNKYRMGWV